MSILAKFFKSIGKGEHLNLMTVGSHFSRVLKITSEKIKRFCQKDLSQNYLNRKNCEETRFLTH